MGTYNVQTQQQGTWVHYTAAEDRDEALEIAKRIFGNKACTGVRVVLLGRIQGTTQETEIHCETRVVKVSDTIRTSQIDWAPPPCLELDEYYSSTARRLMARVLRDYCDKMVVTPTELLYSAKEATRIQDRGTLVRDSIAKVAQLQGGEDAAAAAARAVEMEKAMEQIHSRARKAEKFALPKIKDSFHAVQVAVRSVELQSEKPAYAAKVALAMDLATIRDWLGKVCRACALADKDQDHPESIAVLDGVIADALAGSVVQDVLGYQANLAAAIIAMVDLAEGKLKPEDSDAGRAAATINLLCGQGKLPETRQALIDRAHRQLATGGQLNRIQPEKEKDEYMRVRDRLLRPNGLYQGPDTAEALTLRFGRLIEAGGTTGKKAAFNGVFYSMPDRAASVIYLCDIARTAYAKDLAEDIAEKFDTVMNFRNIADLGRQGMNPKERMSRATNAFNAIAKSDFPEAIKARLCAHLDGMLDRFVVEMDLPTKLDNPQASLKDRAMTLAQFCGSGTLPKGRALSRFLPNLLALVERPDFDAQFVKGAADAAQADKSLKAFKAFVAKLG